MQSSLTQEIVQQNFWELSVDPSESFLDKPLQTNDLSKNILGKGLSLRYLDSSKSPALVSPKRYIKNSASIIQVLQPRRPSVIVSKYSYTKGSSNIVNSSSK